MFYDFWLAYCLQQEYLQDRLRRAERKRLIELSQNRDERRASRLAARVTALPRLLRQRASRALDLVASDYTAERSPKA